MVLAHERAGEGPRPIVLLHGFLGSGRNLRTLARGLSRADPARTVVTLDLTGHGDSPPLPAGADTAVLAADVLDSLDALALTGPLVLVGHSLGGRVALRAAERAAARLRAVLLLDIPPGPLDARGQVARVLDALLAAPATFTGRGAARGVLLDAGLPSALADWLLLNLVPAADGYRWRVDRRALADLHARVAAEDLWPIVERRRPWALACVRGGASRYVGDDAARRLEATGGRVRTIPGAGHFLHAERPDEVLEAVEALLD